MPGPQQNTGVLSDQALQLRNFNPSAAASFQSHRSEPKLRDGIAPLDMNLWRFVPARGIEKHPMRPGPENSGQSIPV